MLLGAPGRRRTSVLLTVALLLPRCLVDTVATKPASALRIGAVLCSSAEPSDYEAVQETERRLRGVVSVVHVLSPWSSMPRSVIEALDRLDDDGVQVAALVNVPSASMLSFETDPRNKEAAGTVEQRAERLAHAAINKTGVVVSRAPAAVCDACAASVYSGAGVRPSDLSCLSGAVVAGAVGSLKSMLERLEPPAGAQGPCNADAAVQHYAAKFPADLIEAEQGAVVSFVTAATGCFALSARFTGLFVKAEAPSCAAEMELRLQAEAQLHAWLEPVNDTAAVMISSVRGRNTSETPRKGNNAPAISHTAQIIAISLLAFGAVAAIALIALWASRRLSRRRRRAPPTRPTPAPRRTTKYATIIYYRL